MDALHVSVCVCACVCVCVCICGCRCVSVYYTHSPTKVLSLTPSIVHRTRSPTFRHPSTDPMWSTYPPLTWTSRTANSVSWNTPMRSGRINYSRGIPTTDFDCLQHLGLDCFSQLFPDTAFSHNTGSCKAISELAGCK